MIPSIFWIVGPLEEWIQDFVLGLLWALLESLYKLQAPGFRLGEMEPARTFTTLWGLTWGKPFFFVFFFFFFL